MKKIIILIGFMFLITGCTNVEYNLTVTNRKVNEEIVIPYKNTEKNLKEIKKKMKTKQQAYHVIGSSKTEYYDSKLEKTKDKLILKYSYSYSPDKFINSEAVNWCFYKKDFIMKDDTLVITTDTIGCLRDEYEQYIDNLTINIKLDNYKVEKDNADKVKDGVYTWYFNNSNSENHTIYLKATKISNKDKKSFEIPTEIFIAVGALLGIALLIMIYLGIKRVKNNKI